MYPGDSRHAEVWYRHSEGERNEMEPCGKMMTASAETVLYSGMDEGENRERGGGDKSTS